MKFQMMALGSSLIAVLAAGCGNGVEGDPLAAAWSNTNCFGTSSMPADVESCSVTLTFSDDLTIGLEATWISLAATATYPGCTTKQIVTGQTWSADHGAETFTVSGKGASTTQRNDCVNSEDNQDAVATSLIAIPSGDTRYSISGETLTVESGTLAGTYNR